jgi:hypothetical protein
MDDKLRLYRQALFLGYKRMFKRYTLQWAVTLTVNYEFDSMMRIRGKVFDWVRKLQKTEHIQVAFVYIICEKGKHQHVHLLMSGRGNHKGEIKSLININRRKWERQWPFFAKIRLVKDQGKASRYLAGHTFKMNCTDYEIDFYNLKLLKKIDTQRPSQ